MTENMKYSRGDNMLTRSKSHDLFSAFSLKRNNSNSSGPLTVPGKSAVSRTKSEQSSRSRHSSARSDGEGSLASPHTNKYSMLEFSLAYYRENLSRYNNNGVKTHVGDGIQDSIKKIESIKLTPKLRRRRSFKAEPEKQTTESWSWKEQAEMIKWTDKPLTDSLLKLPTDAMNRAAVAGFRTIRCIMGDADSDDFYTTLDIMRLMQACKQWKELSDEMYCQLSKQTTNNRSLNSDSCLMGWRLMMLFSSWFSPSPVLEPYIVTYLRQTAQEPSRPFSMEANTCLELLRKTRIYNGRETIPTVEEITDILNGKRQITLPVGLSGGDILMVPVSTSTVAHDVIVHICRELEVESNMEQEEFTMYILTNQGNEIVRVRANQYVRDIITEMSLNAETCSFILERSTWYHRVRIEHISENLLDVVYNQILPDYIEGKYIIVDEGGRLSPKQMVEIVKITALIYQFTESSRYPEDLEDLEFMYPEMVILEKHITEESFLSKVVQELMKVGLYSQYKCKVTIMKYLQTWTLFGSAYFKVTSGGDRRLPSEFTIAINKTGFHFISKKSHQVLQSYSYAELISSKLTYLQNITPAINLKVGNNKLQRIITLGTDHGKDITFLLGQYVRVLNHSAKLSSGYIITPHYV